MSRQRETTVSQSPSLSNGACATLACLLEASAPKPGNVHRGADFGDVTYVDFAVSAAVIGPILEQTRQQGVGATVLQAVRATQAVVGTNTNLGTLLLLAPLAAVDDGTPLQQGLPSVLDQLDVEDTRYVYAAIQTASPGGLGTVHEADVLSNPPSRPLCRLMALAADRDRVARQYVCGFVDVFDAAAAWIEEAIALGRPLAEAIIQAFIRLMARFSDSLIQRKCGVAIADEASARAQHVLQSGQPSEPAYALALSDLDFWLRADGNRRNPGTTADLIAAGLYVLLREDRLDWPIRF